MIVHSYKVYYRNNYQRDWLLVRLRDLLNDDPIWHFFGDGSAITLRVHPQSRIAVEQRFQSDNIPYEDKGLFDPSKDEWPNIIFIGGDLQPIFHELSILASKYPSNVMLDQILERICHILINQQGIHNFLAEANIYADLSTKRASMRGAEFKDPKEFIDTSKYKVKVETVVDDKSKKKKK